MSVYNRERKPTVQKTLPYVEKKKQLGSRLKRVKISDIDCSKRWTLNWLSVHRFVIIATNSEPTDPDTQVDLCHFFKSRHVLSSSYSIKYEPSLPFSFWIFVFIIQRTWHRNFNRLITGFHHLRAKLGKSHYYYYNSLTLAIVTRMPSIVCNWISLHLKWGYYLSDAATLRSIGSPLIWLRLKSPLDGGKRESL